MIIRCLLWWWRNWKCFILIPWSFNYFDIVRAVISLVLTYLRTIMLYLGWRFANLIWLSLWCILLWITILLRKTFVFVVIVVWQGSMMRAMTFSGILLWQNYPDIVSPIDIAINYTLNSISEQIKNVNVSSFYFWFNLDQVSYRVTLRADKLSVPDLSRARVLSLLGSFLESLVEDCIG